jgi:8-oxo-dGTP pyrophosphatase MutT (NUDIX family)
MPSRPVKPRNAASLILVQRTKGGTRVLMGKRPAKAVFPEFYVFPGGRVDKADGAVAPATHLSARTLADLQERGGCTPALARACATAAIRETFEETGLLLAARGDVETHDGPWAHFKRLGLAPAHDRLRFIGRAITPTSAPKRFHARFFVADADALQGELKGNGELLDLDWYPIEEALRLPAVDVTSFVLNELLAAERGIAREAPFFRYRRNRPLARVATG